MHRRDTYATTYIMLHVLRLGNNPLLHDNFKKSIVKANNGEVLRLEYYC